MTPSEYLSLDNVSKKKLLDSMKIISGTKYFGGKALIGKYIFNRIFNLYCSALQNGDRPSIFIDAFTGGGKIALSVPYGWFDTIVMNDLDYGMFCYYKSIKENTDDLIDWIYSLSRNINKGMFQFYALNRCNDGINGTEEDNMKKYGKDMKFLIKEELLPAQLGAMTYIVLNLSFMGSSDYKNNSMTTDPARKYEFNAEYVDRIKKLHRIFVSKNIVIENMDYRDLIKKYNKEDAFKNKVKLWYFDPPYASVTLGNKKAAPYLNTFPIDMTNEMTDILHNDYMKDYGELKYWLKSDYNPKYLLREVDNHQAFHYFDKLEENEMKSEYCIVGNDNKKMNYRVDDLGSFLKGVEDKEGLGDKERGEEYLWSCGDDSNEDSYCSGIII